MDTIFTAIRPIEYTDRIVIVQTIDCILIGVATKIGLKKLIARELTEPEREEIDRIVNELNNNNN